MRGCGINWVFKKDGYLRMDVEDGIGGGKSVRLSRVGYEKGIEKDVVIIVDWRYNEELGF